MGKALKGSFAHILKEESSRQKKYFITKWNRNGKSAIEQFRVKC